MAVVDSTKNGPKRDIGSYWLKSVSESVKVLGEILSGVRGINNSMNEYVGRYQ